MEEPGRLQSMGSPRVGHDWATSLSLFTFMHWRRKWQPTPVFLPGESQGWGSLVAAVCGITQSRTRLKWLSSSSRAFNGIPFQPFLPLPAPSPYTLHSCSSNIVLLIITEKWGQNFFTFTCFSCCSGHNLYLFPKASSHYIISSKSRILSSVPGLHVNEDPGVLLLSMWWPVTKKKSSLSPHP